MFGGRQLTSFHQQDLEERPQCGKYQPWGPRKGDRDDNHVSWLFRVILTFMTLKIMMKKYTTQENFQHFVEKQTKKVRVVPQLSFRFRLHHLFIWTNLKPSQVPQPTCWGNLTLLRNQWSLLNHAATPLDVVNRLYRCCWNVFLCLYKCL